MVTEDLDVVSGPRVERRPQVATLGIREVVPFRTMLANRDRLLAELIEWMTRHEVTASGPFFLRLHVVDMGGLMDIEVGVVAADAAAADSRVRGGTLPAGEYAVLAYRAKSMAANRRLHAWIIEQGLTLDAHPSPGGDVFAARCETYLTDPRTERRKTRWVVELAFLLRA